MDGIPNINFFYVFIFYFFFGFMIVGGSVTMAKFFLLVDVRLILSTDNTVFHGIARMPIQTIPIL